MLDAAALTALRQWRYTPTFLNGVPVATAELKTIQEVITLTVFCVLILAEPDLGTAISLVVVLLAVLLISGTVAAFAGMLYAGRLQSGRFQWGAGDERGHRQPERQDG